jgi:tetratricopeptide (TPR) repeat protein
MKFKMSILLLVILGGNIPIVQACMWDSTTLATEKKRHPELAKVILGETDKPEEPGLLRERIQKLNADRHENDPMWWDDLAVAHMKIGELKEAVALLESVTNRFVNDYGIHANLGTAYHLQGRYQEAEREIARDLEINPEAHFGLERYHLALLKYLNKGKEYQKQHVYIDAWTRPFFDDTKHAWINLWSGAFSRKFRQEGTIEEAIATLQKETNHYGLDEKVLEELKQGVKDPEFRFQWGLVQDPKFEQGVLYMASLNPKEPACFVMLGIMCLAEKSDYNLAAASFQKAIDLGSLQKQVLQERILVIREFKRESQSQKSGIGFLGLLCVMIPAGIVIFGIYLSFKPSGRKSLKQ